MLSSFFRVCNEKLEPRHSAIPVFLMLMWDVFFVLMSQPLLTISQVYLIHFFCFYDLVLWWRGTPPP